MRVASASSFYRLPFDQKAVIEDGSFVNARAGWFGVADGVSAAYSPSNPALLYSTDPLGLGLKQPLLTGGQMVVQELCSYAQLENQDSDIFQLLKDVNDQIYDNHANVGKNPETDNVGGASFAVCQVKPTGIILVIGGDCFVFCGDEQGLHFWTGFDESAFLVEEEANQLFGHCLKKADGQMGKAWDMYYPEYKARKIRCANKNLGNGGYAELNGDPALSYCWSVIRIGVDSHPKFILLGTDGMLPSQAMDKRQEKATINNISFYYGTRGGTAGIQNLLVWRDATERSLHHVEGWPEASAVELKLISD